ncbi:MAG: DEAD/DEAH box helicase family protein, partial [Deltaproteobacteria bacterium]|nr:DEAD/DEAH box helicase family protein [Deltaproteobacteria bacterium]
MVEEIARSRARVDELERARDGELMRIAELEAKIVALDVSAAQLPVNMEPEDAPPSEATGQREGLRSPHVKLQIFRELFRGREDVYPTRFESAKTGKQGYGPACANKFAQGVCELPKVKCGECKNQKFFPADDAAHWKHLAGGHVMGVYPMLPDSTCWFLAVDFDKATWTEDVRAFIATCRKLDLPFLVERSRSGNGAHVWFFFSAPVAAWSARKLGSYVLTQTMAARHELSMDSYDRLFPSQDQMPRGGFGNLIALPLQKEARKLGNTELLDDDLVPYPGEQQWDVLAGVRRIDPAAVERVVADAAREGGVLGVRTSSTDEDARPWLVAPARKHQPVRVAGSLPSRASAVLAQRLFVATASLPSPLINLIKRTAAFENPEFHKKQAMRMSTARTPRVISCAEDLSQHVAVPRGCALDVTEILRDHGVMIDINDERTIGAEIAAQFEGALTPIQQQAANALLASEIGVLVAPPGVGKTVIGTYLIAARRRSTLILVHRGPLLDQWRSQLAMFLGIGPKQIGQIGAGKERITGEIDIAMIQTLARRDDLAELVAGYGHVIVDECHHVSAVSHERVVAATKARYVVGLTATPKRRDGHHPILEMQLGPVRFAIDAKSQAAKRPFEHRLIARETAFRATSPDPKFQHLYALLAHDEARNRMIVNDVIGALEEGRSPLLLTERTDHLDYFAAELSRVARHVIVLKGGMGAKATREAFARMAAIPADAERLVLATGRYIGEGFDDPRLDTLFMTLPVSWQGTLIQYAGRLHRLRPGKR